MCVEFCKLLVSRYEMLTARWQALTVLRLPPSYQSSTCGLLQKFLGCQMCGHLGRLSGHIGLAVVKCVVTSDFELNLIPASIHHEYDSSPGHWSR